MHLISIGFNLSMQQDKSSTVTVVHVKAIQDELKVPIY
jgi:hypothetical protein